MSDAKVKQSVERCKYRHDWQKLSVTEAIPHGGADISCAVCGAFPKAKELDSAQAIVQLRALLAPGDAVYTTLRHVSRSGMCRRITLCVGTGGEVKNISWLAAHAMDYPVKNRAGWVQDTGIEIGGCGMDMGFGLVYNLGRVLYPKGFACVGAKCQSNEHFNDANCRREAFKGKMHTGDGGYALKHQWL